MLSLIVRTFQLLVFHFLICIVDRITRLPRNSTPPDIMRILRENMALKAQVRALVLELKAAKGKRPKLSIATRAAQVFAALLTRGDKAFQNYYLSASTTTISRWAAIFRCGPWPWRKKDLGGRLSLAQEIKNFIIKIKTTSTFFVSVQPITNCRRLHNR